MKEKLLHTLDKTITYSFYLLFFLVPLFLTPYNYELFEYNKMMLVYGITAVTISAWMGKMILTREVKIARTPLDLPLLLFLLSQIISTLFSWDRHVSLWGYYSRFNGGLVSTISYILLYYTFVTSFPKEKVLKLLKIALFSGFLVAVYGILEHFGIDRDLWVQDVQNRVFSTLGQPNWLAAYLAVLIPITLGINSKFEYRNSKQHQNNKGILSSRPKRRDLSRMRDFVSDKLRDSSTTLGMTPGVNLFRIYLSRVFPREDFVFWILASLFFVTLLFTKSRSGFIGLWTSLIVLWSICIIPYLVQKLQPQKITHIHATASICVKYIKLIGIYISSFIFISFFIGTPIQGLNRFTLPELLNRNQPFDSAQGKQPSKPLGSSVIEIGITGSGTIRRIVWQGAIDISRNYPLFGTGVETFAFSYYKFRPQEHNLTSEWDFLYNKAHNEYLNYAATTGIFGLGSYLFLIGSFIWWNIKKFKAQSAKPFTLNSDFALFSSWLSILITNFFGFSVVLIQLFFFLIPAISFVITQSAGPLYLYKNNQLPISSRERVSLLILLFVLCYMLFGLTRTWYADTLFAQGYRFSRNGEYTEAYQKLKEALLLNTNEPLYYDEFALPAAQLAVAFSEQQDSTTSSQLVKEALLSSTQAVTTSPANVNFWKSRTRVFYALSQIDETYLTRAREALEKARALSPTDPKISYNLAILLDREEKREDAIALLIATTKLKPDYRDAFFALALFYEQNKEREKAKEMFNYILTRISPNDEDVKKQLEGLK